MDVTDELKALDKCNTCKFSEACITKSDYLLDRPKLDLLKSDGIHVKVVIFKCKHYRRR